MTRSPYIVFLILLIFFIISFITNIIGPLIPEIIESFDLSLTLVALIPFAFFIAYGVMSIPAGMLLLKFKEKHLIVLAFIVIFFGAILLALLPSYLTALFSFFIIGCGMAVLQVVINPLLRVTGGEEHFAMYAVFAQLVFGFASFLSPLVYTQLASETFFATEHSFLHTLSTFLSPQELPWIFLYFLFSVISLFMILILIFSKFPQVELKSNEKSGALGTHIKLFKNKQIRLFFLGMICYVGAEQGIANWISQFLNVYHGIDPKILGAATISDFWGLMTLGGIIGLILLKIFDSRWVLITFSGLAMICLILALFGPAEIALICFPLTGLFLSVMYPILFSLTLNSFADHHGSISGILVTGIIGGAILPLIIGWFGDAVGLRSAMCFLIFPLAFIVSIGFWAKPLITNKKLSWFYKGS
ncbi:MAG: MFS transporter [Cyclobacteriaceae bacterium]|nr:MFS transporter [Cyclobacteriaceae bacterium]